MWLHFPLRVLAIAKFDAMCLLPLYAHRKNRMRGYYGMPGSTSYYSTPDRKFNTHRWENPRKVITAREWPTAWIGIDGDEAVNEERAL
jgi:hypothetical protein